VAEVIWRWIERWGHDVLDILSLATFAPPPFVVVGIASSATNATWYAIDGDYGMAGLSLAAAVPGLAVGKIAKGVKAGVAAEKTAAEADVVAKAVKEIRAGADVAAQRVNLSKATKDKIREAAPKTADGEFIEANTGKIVPREGPFDYGHKPGYEWRCTQARARLEGWTPREQVIAYENDPAHYQIEDPSSNRSHRYEAAVCAK